MLPQKVTKVKEKTTRQDPICPFCKRSIWECPSYSGNNQLKEVHNHLKTKLKSAESSRDFLADRTGRKPGTIGYYISSNNSPECVVKAAISIAAEEGLRVSDKIIHSPPVQHKGRSKPATPTRKKQVVKPKEQLPEVISNPKESYTMIVNGLDGDTAQIISHILKEAYKADPKVYLE